MCGREGGEPFGNRHATTLVTGPAGGYGSGMPLHHVAYATKDVEATTRFYEELMGFPLVYTETTADRKSTV